MEFPLQRFCRCVRRVAGDTATIQRSRSRLLLLLGLFFAQSAQAGFDHFYVEPQISNDKLKLNSGSYTLIGTGFKGGFYINRQIAFEVLFVKGKRENTINDLTVKLDNRSSFFFRYGSDYRKPIRAYMSLGQSNTKISYDGPVTKHTDKLSDLSWALGAEERIRSLPGFFFNLEYARHFSNIDQFYSGISMGLRYEF